MKISPLLQPRPRDIAIAALFCVPWAGLQVAGALIARTPAPAPTHVVIVPPGGPGHPLRLEVADSGARQRQGLSGRMALRQGEGMYFPVRPPGKPRLWMKGMTFPIDVVFLRAGRVTEVLYALPPCRAMCPTYLPHDTVDGALELRAEEAVRLGLTPGAVFDRALYAAESNK